MLPDRQRRIQGLGDVRGSWNRMGQLKPSDAKLGDDITHFLHLTEDAALLKIMGAIFAMSERATVLSPGERLSFALDHGRVDFNGKALNPLATEGSSAALLVPTLIEGSPLDAEDLRVFQGIVGHVESLLQVLGGTRSS